MSKVACLSKVSFKKHNILNLRTSWLAKLLEHNNRFFMASWKILTCQRDGLGFRVQGNPYLPEGMCFILGLFFDPQVVGHSEPQRIALRFPLSKEMGMGKEIK